MDEKVVDQLIEQQLKEFFSIKGDVSREELISKYKDAKGIDKSSIWKVVGKHFEDSNKAYKYFTNTWSRNSVNKWPKQIKIEYKKLLIAKIQEDTQNILNISARRLKIIQEFQKQHQIKEKYPQYHFDSLYFYFYNIVTAELKKVNPNNNHENKLQTYEPQQKIIDQHNNEKESNIQYRLALLSGLADSQQLILTNDIMNCKFDSCEKQSFDVLSNQQNNEFLNSQDSLQIDSFGLFKRQETNNTDYLQKELPIITSDQLKKKLNNPMLISDLFDYPMTSNTESFNSNE